MTEIEREYYIEQYLKCLRGCSRYPISHTEDTQIKTQAHSHGNSPFRFAPDGFEIFQGASKTLMESTDILPGDDIFYYGDDMLERGILIL